MSNSNRRPAGGKARPKPPRPDFPLRIHKGQGRWCKKVRGHVYYFGRVADDPKGIAALEEWNRVRGALLAGQEYPDDPKEGRTIADLCNEFLDYRQTQLDNGEMKPRTFWGWHDTCALIVGHFGKDRALASLTPADFAGLRKELAKTRGLVALKNEIGRIRGVFRFGMAQGLVAEPVQFGVSFDKPRKEKIDAEREAHRAEHGPRMFEAAEIRAILARAKQPLKAMILLAINTGFGNADLSALPEKAVDLEAGTVDFARVKTSIRRGRVPLWAETVASIREWLPLRPKAKDPGDRGLLFVTCRGQRWVKLSKGGKPKLDARGEPKLGPDGKPLLTVAGSPADALSQEFNKVLSELGLKRPRVSFYALRHTFETIAGETLDQIATDVIMGHKIKGMAAAYIERIGDDRLRRVTDHVRAWLFAESDDGPKLGEPEPACEAPASEADASDTEDEGPTILRLRAC